MKEVLSGAEKGLVALLFGTLLLASVDNQLLIPLLPTLSTEFGVSLKTLGLLFSIYALAAALFNLLLGPLTDRFGRVPFLRIGLALYAGLAIATANSGSYDLLFWLRAGTGLAAGLLSTCAAGSVGDRFSYRRRGRVMGLVLSSYFASLILGVPLSAWIAQTWGWRFVFVLSGLGAMVMFLLSYAIGGKPERPLRPPSSAFSAYLGQLSRRSTASALTVSFLVSGGTLAFLTFISAYLDRGSGLSPVQISSVFVIAGAAALLGSPVSGWLSDHWTKRRVFLWSNSVLGVLLLMLTRSWWIATLGGILFVLSLGVSFRQTALQTLQTELAGERERGSFLALRNCFSQLGISFSVFVAGSLFDVYGYAAVAVWSSLLTLAGSIIFFFWVDEPETRSSSPLTEKKW